MERARHRKSKSATSIEGIRQSENYKVAPRLSSDSRTHGGTSATDRFMLELGQSSSRRTSGTPMKKLLAEEMSKENEVKRRTPSVIARLMGLDGLPSPRHVHRPQKSSSDNHYGQLLNRQSSRRISMEQQEFKDVYEDVEASQFASQRHSSRWNANSKLTKHESSLIQQKFKNAQHLPVDEKLQEVDPCSCPHGHTEFLKPSDSAQYECYAKAWKSHRVFSRENDMTSHQTREDGLLLHQQNRHRSHTSCKSPKIQLDEIQGRNSLPTRIVVLKPNLGKMHNAGAPVSSPDSYPSNFVKLGDYTSFGGPEMLLRKRRDSSDDVGSLKPLSRDAREIAREITRRMRDGCDGFIDQTSSGVRGYAGDESSYDACESDSASELEVFKLSSRNSTCCNNRCKHSSVGSIESSVHWEAKKRLSDRWKRTQRSQDFEMVGNASTLGEVLGKPDREMKAKHFNGKVGLERKTYARNSGAEIQDVPLHIGYTDGWKDGYNKISARSRSLPPSSMSGKSRRRRAHSVALAEDQYLMHNDIVNCGTRESVKGNLSWKGDISSKDLQCKSKKSSCHHNFTSRANPLTECNFETKTEMNFETSAKEQQSTSQIAAKSNTYTILVPDAKTAAKHGASISSSKSSELHLKQSSSEVEKDESADKEDPCFQEPLERLPKQVSSSMLFPGAEPDSSESSKNTDYHSPVSVLEVPFSEDISSSESFERVSAELHELRMQLRLLKMESGTYPQDPAREEDTAQSSSIDLEQHNKLEAEDWEASYVLDVVMSSGFEESDLDLFKTTWHSEECPLDPKLFDHLEKKYSNENTESRYERRLLFDRINLALVDVHHQLVDTFPWVMPKLTGTDSKRPKQLIRDRVQKLLSGQVCEAEGEMPERTLDRDMQWFGFKGEIDVIGKEIEQVLIDEMIAEVQSL